MSLARLPSFSSVDSILVHDCGDERIPPPVLIGRNVSFGAGSSNLSAVEKEDIIPWGAVIRFEVSSVSINFLNPWKTEDSQKWTGSGFFIGNRQILTNHHVISQATSIRVERNGMPGNFPAVVVSRSELCDLALVTVEEDAFWEHLTPVEFMSNQVPRLGDSVLALGYPLDAKTATVTKGIVSSIEMKDLTLKDYNPTQLHCVIDASINGGNSGGPVIDEKTGKVVGVAFAGTRNAQGRNFIISMPVVRMFLKAYALDKRTNFGLLPETGISVEALVNLSQRRKCLQDEALVQMRLGCLINYVDPFSCAAGLIRAGDVLMAIDGHSVSEKGEVVFRQLEMLPYTFYVNNKLCGSSVTLTVCRSNGDLQVSESTSTSTELLCTSATGRGNGDDNGIGSDNVTGESKIINNVLLVQELTIDLVLTPSKPIVPRINGCDYFPKWVIIGGLVFVIFGRPLLDFLIEKKKYNLVNSLYDILIPRKRMCDDEEVVVLVDVLEHDVNVTYDRYIGRALAYFNDIPIVNIRQLAFEFDKVKNNNSIQTTQTAKSEVPDSTVRSSTDQGISIPTSSSPPGCKYVELTFSRVGDEANPGDAGGRGRKCPTCSWFPPRYVAVLEVDRIKAAESDILAMNKVPSWCSPELL